MLNPWLTEEQIQTIAAAEQILQMLEEGRDEDDEEILALATPEVREYLAEV
jgi:hypothetical protein